MARHVFQTCPVQGAATDVHAAFTEDPGVWLPEPADPVDEGIWVVRLSAGPVTRPVHATVGAPWDLGEVTWRVIRWQPPADSTLQRALPAFAGEIGFRPSEPGTLVVQGEYAPPGGPVGEAIDAIALHRVADRTIHALIVAVSERLQQAASTRTPRQHT